VRTEVIPYDIDLTGLAELGDYRLRQEMENVFSRLGVVHSADCVAGVRSEGRQQLNRRRSMISRRPAGRPFAPTATTSRNRGQWPHLVNAHDNAIARRRAVEVYDLVFLPQNPDRCFRTMSGLP
jgi:hypothetical protein